MAMIRVLMIAVLWTLVAAVVIDQPSPAYNVTESQELVKFAAVAFCDDACIVPWTCKTTKEHPLTDILYIDQAQTKVHGYVGYRPDVNQIIGAFRGSHNTQNWIEDANFEKVPYLACLNC